MSEELLPPYRREVSNVRGFGYRNPLQHIDKVGVGINPMQSARDDEGLKLPDILRANLSPAKEPVLATHRNRSERPLKVVGINRHIGVIKILRE